MDKLFIAAIKKETIGLDYFKHIGVGKINATYNTLILIMVQLVQSIPN
jgi:adenosylhomocysteine nucleosidase